MEKQGYFVHQNLGVFDRTIRVIIGSLMLGVPYVQLVTGADLVWWHSLSMVVSTYPILTGICGRDVLYDYFKVSSCSMDGKNQCGSYPFQLANFFGHKRIPEDHQEHTLLHSSPK
jgi:hypothetical protein